MAWGRKRRIRAVGASALVVACGVVAYVTFRPVDRRTASEEAGANVRLDCPTALMRVAANEDYNRKTFNDGMSVDSACARELFTSFNESYALESFLATNPVMSLGLPEGFLTSGCFPAIEVDGGWFQRRILSPKERNSVVAEYYMDMNRARQGALDIWRLMAGTHSVLASAGSHGEAHTAIGHIECSPLFPGTCDSLKQLKNCPISEEAFAKIFRATRRQIDVIITYDNMLGRLRGARACDKEKECGEIIKLRTESYETFPWREDPDVRNAVEAYRQAYSDERIFRTDVPKAALAKQLAVALKRRIASVDRALLDRYEELVYAARCLNGYEGEECASNDFGSISRKQGAAWLHDWSPFPKSKEAPHVQSAAEILNGIQPFDYDPVFRQIGNSKDPKAGFKNMFALSNAECRNGARTQMERANIIQQRFAFEVGILGLGTAASIFLEGLATAHAGTVLIPALYAGLEAKPIATLLIAESPHIFAAGLETAAIVTECRELLKDVIEHPLPRSSPGKDLCSADPATVVVRTASGMACASVVAQYAFSLGLRSAAMHSPHIYQVLKGSGHH